MPISIDGSGNINLTAPDRGDLFSQTGVAHTDAIAICDKTDLLKQLNFDTSAQQTNTTVTLKTGASTGNIVITLPTTSTDLGSLAGTVPATAGGTGITTYNTGDTLYASAANTLSALPVGTSCQKLSILAGVPIWTNNVLVTNSAEYYDEFDASNASEITGWGNNGSGGSSSAGSTIDAGHPGCLRQAVSSSGNTAIVYRDTNYMFGGGALDVELLFRSLQTSNSSDTFQTIIGFSDVFNGGTANNGAYFVYSSGVNSGQWQCCTANSSTTTTTNTTTAFTANAWNKLHISINAAGTSIAFSINGVVVATNTTNIPAGKTGFVLSLAKTNGSTDCFQYFDYWYFRQILTTPR